MFSSTSANSISAQAERLSKGLSDLHERLMASHEDVRALIEIMLRSELRANELLAEIKEATARLRRFNDQAQPVNS
jgi:hypothetical protein